MFLRLVFLFAGFSALLLQAQPVNDTLRRTDAATAANVIGLSFTEPELDSLLFTLRTRRAEYRKLHGLDLPNSVPMSLWQSPLLPGRALPPAAPPVNWKLPKKVVLPA
ncbi:MAG TPA: hypothetical protein PKE63_12080, partial [Lacibacter sp.]|nr:hypothetical protein [Lacibacter sp.]